MKRTQWMILVLLVAGLAACTKSEDDGLNINQSQIEHFYSSDIELGEFEGVWVVDQQEIDTAKLTVTENTFLVRFPERYLINKAFYDIAYDPSEVQYSNQYASMGFSDRMVYFDFVVDSQRQNTDADNAIDFQSSQPGVAIFDLTTRLWTLKISLDTASQKTADGTSVENNITPIVLVYIAKRKI
jgi:hypothetical protein